MTDPKVGCDAVIGQTGTLIDQNKEMSRQIGLLAQEMAKGDERVSAEIEALKDACRDLLNHAHRTDVRLTRLEEPRS